MFLICLCKNYECLALLIVKEIEQCVGVVDYLNILKNQNLYFVARKEVVDWISKVWLILFQDFFFVNLGLIFSCLFVFSKKKYHFFLIDFGILESWCCIFWLILTRIHAQFNFGPLCECLFVNYLDNFLVVDELPVS